MDRLAHARSRNGGAVSGVQASIAAAVAIAAVVALIVGRETVGLALALAVVLVMPGYVAFIVQSRARSRAERKLADVAESLPGAVFQLRRRAGGDATFEFLSGGTEAVRRVSRDLALKDAALVVESIVDEDRADFLVALNQAEAGLEAFERDFRVRDVDGTVQWIHTSALPRREMDGSVLWTGHWSNVSEKKRMESALVEAKEAAERADRAKSTFLATMSHEIRTPMNGLLGMLELLALSKLDPQQEATVATARTSGKALLCIIDDILDFSKIEAGRIEIRPEATSLDRVIETTVTIYAGNASSKGLTLRTSLDSRVAPIVVADPLRLAQILNNFVSNAITYTERGHVELSTLLVERSDTRQVVRFSVVDSGVGMTPEEQARLFDAFSLSEQGWQRRTGSSGLGLSICRRLAELMGGEITVSSAPGRGTRMSVTLPLQLADPRDVEQQRDAAEAALPVVRMGARRMPPPVEAAEAEGTLVLVADDHPINRLLMQRQLAILGYASLLANDGLEAFALWKAHRFGIVITDCNMPRMDGFELARRIRGDEAPGASARVRILACTANAMREDAARCFEAGMDDYLAKPVEIGELGARLDRWLPIPQSADDTLRLPAVSQCSDFTMLVHYSGGDRELERRLLGEFRKATEQDRAALDAALLNEDSIGLARAFHRIKGASRTIGADDLAQICEELEHASRNRNVDAVRSRLDAFSAEVGRLDERIARY